MIKKVFAFSVTDLTDILMYMDDWIKIEQQF
jgi:hypothetical protein